MNIHLKRALELFWLAVSPRGVTDGVGCLLKPPSLPITSPIPSHPAASPIPADVSQLRQGWDAAVAMATWEADGAGAHI